MPCSVRASYYDSKYESQYDMREGAEILTASISFCRRMRLKGFLLTDRREQTCPGIIFDGSCRIGPQPLVAYPAFLITWARTALENRRIITLLEYQPNDGAVMAAVGPSGELILYHIARETPKATWHVVQIPPTWRHLRAKLVP